MDTEETSLPNKCCFNCHFLCAIAKASKKPHEINKESRRKLLKGEQIDDVIGGERWLGCEREVWRLKPRTPDEGAKESVSMLKKGRGESCFFYPHTPGTPFEVAAELEKRAADRREAEADRELTRGVANTANRTSKLAIAAIILAALLGVLGTWLVSRRQHLGTSTSQPAASRPAQPSSR